MSEQAQRNAIAALYLVMLWTWRITFTAAILYIVFGLQNSAWFLLLLIISCAFGKSAKNAKRIMSAEAWPTKVKKEATNAS